MLARPRDVNAVVNQIVEEHNDLAGTFLSTKVLISAGTFSRVYLMSLRPMLRLDEGERLCLVSPPRCAMPC